jgi:hypothetical protein
MTPRERYHGSMRNTPFVNVCLVLIIALLCVIAFRTTSAYAAKPVSYQVVHVVDNHIEEQVAKETQAGWEPVSMTMWVDSPAQYANGVVIFRK